MDFSASASCIILHQLFIQKPTLLKYDDVQYQRKWYKMLLICSVLWGGYLHEFAAEDRSTCWQDLSAS